MLVKYKSGAAAAEISAAAQRVGGEVVDNLDFLGVKLVKVAPEKNLTDTASALQATGAVEYADATIASPLLLREMTRCVPAVGLPKINAPTAWGRITQAANVTVAIITPGFR